MDIRDLKSRIIPTPQFVEEKGGRVKIAEFGKGFYGIVSAFHPDGLEKSAYDKVRGSVVELCAAVPCGEEMTDWSPAGEKKYEIVLRVDPDNARFAENGRAEAYFISTNENGADLCGYDSAGLFYAAVTFSHMLEKEGDEVFVPFAEIYDYPEFTDRGNFLECRYGSDFMTKEDYVKAIDYFADMKINQLTVGLYGCWCVQYDKLISEYLYLPIKKHPELKTPRNIKYYSAEERKWVYKKNVLPTMFKEDYLSDIMAYGKTKNVMIKPLFNSLGHNTLIPRLIPEISAKDENGNPTGHYFCVSDEKTYDVMFDIYDELIDNYMTPNGITAIEIGLDEVYAGLGENTENVFGKYSPHCRCEKCRSVEFKELMLRYVERICGYLKKKGMKSIYIYQDMFQFHFNCINEELAERFKKAGIYDVVVFDWWRYSSSANLFRDWDKTVNNLFRSIIKPFNGYYHWSIPLEYNDNIWGCAKIAYDRGFEGIEAYGAFEYCFDKNFLYLAEIAWNRQASETGTSEQSIVAFTDRYAYRYYPHNFEKAKEAFEGMRQLMTGDYIGNYLNSLEYYIYSYVRDGKKYPRQYPGEMYQAIFASRDAYMPVFERKRGIAKECMDFFTAEKESLLSNDKVNNVWYNVALQYYVTCNEYLTLISAVEDFNDGKISSKDVIALLAHLIREREKLIRQTEITRIEANRYLFLRNQSIYRQYLICIKEYFEKKAASGESFKFDLTDSDAYMTDGFRFLQ